MTGERRKGRELRRAVAHGHPRMRLRLGERQLREEEVKQERERRIQEAMLDIKKKYGKNAILSGGSYLDGATARERNRQIGGHKA